MCDILKSNFESKFTEITNALKNASFISIDCEFTGLLSNEKYRSSLFDSPTTRYSKARSSCECFSIIQLGLSAFKYLPSEGKCIASTYTFYLYPKSFCKINPITCFETNSVEFLCNFNLDFNKTFYEGISFLNKNNKLKIKNELKKKPMFQLLEGFLSYEEEDLVRDYCSKVAEWASSKSEEMTLKVNSSVLCCFMHQQIRNRFPSLWTFHENEFEIIIKKVNDSTRKQLYLESINNKFLENQFYNSLIGFSKLFDYMISLKKPLVGHNMFLDLLMLYKQFIEPLPKSYETFKSKISEIFPCVYDTKSISFDLRDKLKKTDNWPSNSVQNLYEYFKNGRGKYLGIYLNAPHIDLNEGFQLKQDCFHEAGHDSFYTGYCFFKMAFLFITWNPDKRDFIERKLPPLLSEYFVKLTPLKNKVNLIRASLDYIQLDGPDPINKRPPILLIEQRGFKSINIDKIAQLIGTFGTIDIKPHTRTQALVAVGNRFAANDILHELKRHGELRVSNYNPLRHSIATRNLLFGSFFASATFCTYWIFQILGKPKS